jgi:hypothetical protein
LIRTALLSILLLSACITEEAARRDKYYDDHFAYFERVGVWVITCTDYIGRDDGTIRPYNSCSLRKAKQRGTFEGGNALVVTAFDGRQMIVGPPGDRYCRSQPRSRVIDGAFVQNWPMVNQIEALKSGARYSEEFMPKKWPECWILVRTASLAGFSDAHLRFEEIARARGALW